MYLYGVWVYGSIYFKYIFGGIYLCCFLWYVIRRKGDLPARQPYVRLAFTIVLTLAVVLYFTGTTGIPAR